MDDLPPGYRFYPTEEELVSFYLAKKLNGDRVDLQRVIPVVDIYELDPWQLPNYSGKLCHGDPEQWFYFCPRQEREARGGRPNRITKSGYWKATGSPGYVYSSDDRIIGVKKTMVFYKGKAPTGRKTKWKTNEYKAIDGEATTSTTLPPELRQEFSVCRVYVKSGCLRAFDRRPTVTNAHNPPPPHAHQAHDNVPSTSHQNLKVSNTHDTSSSADPSQNGDTSDWEIGHDLAKLTDWD